MPTVRYSVINGQIVAEKRGGVRKFYSSDALGSTVALYDDTQAKTDTFTYWPYGETRTRTGSTPTKYKYVGTLGCREQADGGIYMQARIEQPKDGRWMTVDPLWPGELAYRYGISSPVTFVDPAGANALLFLAMSTPVTVDPKRCVVRICSMYGFADDGGPIWDQWIITHQYVCAITPTGRKCAWGNGGYDQNSPCHDDDSRGFPIRCITVSTNCRIAAAACICIERLRANPPTYEVPFQTCYQSKNHVKRCIEELLGGLFYLGEGKYWGDFFDLR